MHEGSAREACKLIRFLIAVVCLTDSANLVTLISRYHAAYRNVTALAAAATEAGTPPVLFARLVLARRVVSGEVLTAWDRDPGTGVRKRETIA